MALGVVVGAWVARYLGPLSFGQLSYATAYVALFQTIATLGLDGVVVRDIARNQKIAGELLGTVFMLRLCAGSFSWLIAVCVLAISKGPGDTYVFLTAILGTNLVFQAGDAIDLWFQSQSQNRRTVFAKLFAGVISNILKVALIYIKAPVYAFAAVLALEIALGALALGIVYRFFPAPQRWQWRRSQAVRVLNESWPFMLAAGVNMIQARVEYVMIESFLGAAALGQYAAAARFVEIFDIIFISLAASIYPRAASQANDRWDFTFRKMYLLAMLTYAAIVPLLFVVWLCLGLIYGPSYAMARELFPLMAIRPLLGYIGITKSMAIRVNFWSHYALISSTVGALVASAGAYVLLPRYGLHGAILASLSSYLISNVIIDAIFYRSNFKNMVYCWKEWPYFFQFIKRG
jgi:PST family polysaccharide transporter